MTRLLALAATAVAAAAALTVACEDSSPPGPQPEIPAGGAGAPDTGVDSGSGPGPAADGGAEDGGIDCPTPTSGPTQHSGSIGTETWTADTSPHVLPYDTAITGTLTLEPCAEVLVGAGKSIDVNSTGKLVGQGLPRRPIHIGPSDTEKPFAQLYAGGGGTIHLAYTAIDGGGDPQNSVVDIAGTIRAQGEDQYAASQPTVFVDHVTITGSKSNGVTLIDGAGFAPGSQNLDVHGSAQYPVSLWPRAVGTLPGGSYTGNAKDEILLVGGGGAVAVQEDATMRDVGVPYHVGNSLSFGDLVIERQAPSTPGLATLTIDPGVVIRMKKDGTVQVQRFTGSSPAAGALVVKGTAAKPVVFTSAEPTPAAGDWLGIWFGEIPAPNDKIDYARIEYAGGLSSSGSEACNTPGTNDAAIRLFGPPSGAFVTNTTILNSAGHGIDRGWRDDATTDFLATNTFTSVAKCKQSYPRDTNGACPTPVPCP